MNLAQFIRWATRQIDAIWQRIEKIDVQWRLPPSNPRLVLSIVGGNTLETGQAGIVYTTSVASVPSAYDPDVTSTFIDGIGRATLYKNGVAQAGYVLVVNSDDGTFRNALFQNDTVYTGGAIAIPVAAGGAVLAYVAGG